MKNAYLPCERDVLTGDDKKWNCNVSIPQPLSGGNVNISLQLSVHCNGIRSIPIAS